MDTIAHAYGHLTGRTVGIKLPEIGIVAGTVMPPEIGQDHNDVLVMTADSAWHLVRYMDTYRADFVNAWLD